MPSIPLILPQGIAGAGLTLAANVYTGSTLSASPSLTESPANSGRYTGTFDSSAGAAVYDWTAIDGSGNAYGGGAFETDSAGNEIDVASRVGVALPNAAPAAAGGLLTIGAGAGQINPNGDGSVPTTGASGSGAFSLTVHVTDGASPIAGAFVRISGAQAAGAIVTDSSGNALVALNSGTVTVSATAPGHGGYAAAQSVTGAGQWTSSGSATLAISLTPASAALSAGAGQTTAYLTVRDGQGDPVTSGVTLTFSLIDPQASVDSFDQSAFTATSDNTGLLQILLRQSTTYQARVATGPWTTFTTGSATSFALPEILGNYTD